ncbi:hypothetical protein BDZ45DRAFT_718034 [Acephala macrosclerotiorum]|nr:hypothetical protein BDZ45DRAFT_718034 [Acephala macrosclerotiorum]
MSKISISLFLFSILLPIFAQFIPSPGSFPPPGGDPLIPATDPEAPTTPSIPTNDSGPYPATLFTDALLPNHTIYAPISPPKGPKLPFISWSNGICETNGLAYRFFLTEIASWGYVVAAEGLPGGYPGNRTMFSTVAESRAAINWAMDGGGRKYGIDREKVATAGHCGGLEGLSTAYRDQRVERILLFDISIFGDDKRYLLEAIDVLVAWFEGGKLDFTYPLAVKDYALLNEGLPTFKVSLDTGHYGTYFATNGGKFGKAAVDYLECLNPGSLVSQNWTVEYKNWF